jgi:hypothetical protein
MIKAALSLPPFIECGSLAGEDRFPTQYELTVHQKSKSV